MTEHHHSPETKERDYTDRDIHLPSIVKFTVYIVLFTAATFWGAKYMLDRLGKNINTQTDSASPFAGERIIPVAPLLQPDEKRTLDEQHALEHAKLETYGWVDQAGGVVHIPVERAMDLVLERGLPTRPAK